MRHFLLGAFVMWVAWGFSIYVGGTVATKVTQGKIFKINDSTYKCKMINTLTYGEKE